MKHSIWLYWENMKGKQEPPYITLCRWSMTHHWKNHQLVFLTPDNIEYYYPGITKLTYGIESSIKGRLDELKRKFIKSKKSLAVKADVIRALMLSKYGGLYIDSSAIALAPLDDYFESLSTHKPRFLISKRNSHNRQDYPVSFYGCNTSSIIINEYAEQIIEKLKIKKHFDYNGLGTLLLTPIVNKYIEECVIIPEDEIMPITHEDAESIYLSTSLNPSDYITDKNRAFKIFHPPFNGDLGKLSINELYNENLFISRLFRFALPRNIFEKNAADI